MAGEVPAGIDQLFPPEAFLATPVHLNMSLIQCIMAER